MGEITEMVQIEVSLPDESRFQILWKVPACPRCDCIAPKLWIFPEHYEVRCENPMCHFTTPPMKHSDQAVKHWIMVARLSQ